MSSAAAASPVTRRAARRRAASARGTAARGPRPSPAGHPGSRRAPPPPDSTTGVSHEVHTVGDLSGSILRIARMKRLLLVLAAVAAAAAPGAASRRRLLAAQLRAEPVHTRPRHADRLTGTRRSAPGRSPICARGSPVQRARRVRRRQCARPPGGEAAVVRPADRREARADALPWQFGSPVSHRTAPRRRFPERERRQRRGDRVATTGRQVAAPEGNWDFDALYGNNLFLIKYLSGGGYQVQLVDLSTAARREPSRIRTSRERSGGTFSRIASADGRKLFTLYVSNGARWSTSSTWRRAKARCIDLPGTGDYNRRPRGRWRSRPDGRTLWAAAPGYGRVVAIDVRTRKVAQAFRVQPAVLGSDGDAGSPFTDEHAAGARER